LRDDGWREVSAGAKRPEVRSARRDIGEEDRLRVDDHFDIATIEDGRCAGVAQLSLWCEGYYHALATNGDASVASCVPASFSLKLAFGEGELRNGWQRLGTQTGGTMVGMRVTQHNHCIQLM